MKKICTFLTVLALVIICVALLPMDAEAAEIIDSGTCGENLTWTLDSDGILTISGHGDIPSYEYGEQPWAARGLLIKTIVINQGITCIGHNAFFYDGNSSLTKVILPEGLTSIGTYAFAYCENLKEITIPESLSKIYNWAFSNCTAITHVYISDIASWCSIDFIHNSVYSSNPLVDAESANLYINNKKLSGSITIPDGVRTIPAYAFKGCDEISSITIPESVKSIEIGAFDNCLSLETIHVEDSNSNYAAKDGILYNKAMATLIRVPEGKNGDVVLPTSLRTIGQHGFSGCDQVTSVILPDSLSFIEKGAFSNCSNVKRLSIPDSVMYIDILAFENCSGLTEIDLPKSLTSINWCLFVGCSSLEEITIHEGVTSIDSRAFDGCTSLAAIRLPSTLTSIGGAIFAHCENLWHILYNGTNAQWAGIDINHSDIITSDGSYLSNYWIPNHYNYSGDADIDIDNKRCSICVAECPHNWDSGTVIKQATCLEEGAKAYTCIICNATKTETIAKLSTHSYDNGKVTKEATCKEEGVKTYTCTVCKKTKTEAIAKLTTHTPGAEATATTPQICTVCGKELKPATGATEPPATETPATKPPATEPPVTESPVIPTQPEDPNKPDDGEFPVVVIVAIVVLAGGGAAAGVILWKKKH